MTTSKVAHRSSRRLFVVASATLLTSVLLTSCGRGSQTLSTGTATASDAASASSTQPPSTDSMTTIVADSARITATVQAGGLTLDPAPADMQPAVTADVVLQTFKDMGVYPGVDKAAPLPPTVQFGLVTNPTYGPVDASGVLKPTYVRTPAWIIWYKNLPPIPSQDIGGIRDPKVTQPATDTGPIDMIVVFDAQTGKALFSRSFNAGG